MLCVWLNIKLEPQPDPEKYSSGSLLNCSKPKTHKNLASLSKLWESRISLVSGFVVKYDKMLCVSLSIKTRTATGSWKPKVGLRF